jgi:hypothetical protein
MGRLAGSKVRFDGIVGVGDTIPIGREKGAGVVRRQVACDASRPPARQRQAQCRAWGFPRTGWEARRYSARPVPHPDPLCATNDQAKPDGVS